PTTSPLFPYTTLFRSQFWDYVSRVEVNFLDCVPSYLAGIIGSAPVTLSLDHLILGGESFATELYHEISHLNVARITNLYGPAERSEEHTSELQSPYDL